MGHILPELRRWPYQSHVIYYIPDTKGIFIARGFHQRMDAPIRLQNDQQPRPRYSAGS